MNSPVVIDRLVADRASVCRRLLESLPDWFGIPQAIDDYCNGVERCACWVARTNDHDIGIIAMEVRTEATEEIYVMAIDADFHRQGIGRRLLAAAEEAARGAGRELLMVKTLSPSRSSEHYDRTREFYRGVGFAPLEERPELWGPANPCLVMVKPLTTS